MVHAFAHSLTDLLKPLRRSIPFGLLVGWSLCVLLPVVYGGPDRGVQLAQATLGVQSIPFLRHCPAPVLVAHLMSSFLLVPAVLFLARAAHRNPGTQPRLGIHDLLPAFVSGIGLLLSTQLLAAACAVAFEGAHAAVTLAWVARLLSYDVLTLTMWTSLVLALVMGTKRYATVVIATAAIVLLQSVASLWLGWRSLGPWLPSQLRVELSSGSPDSTSLVGALFGWAALAVAVLLMQCRLRSAENAAPGASAA